MGWPRLVGTTTWPATYEHFTGSGYVATNLAEWWSEEYLRRALIDSLFLVAETDDRIIGVVEVVEPTGRWYLAKASAPTARTSTQAACRSSG